MMTSPVPDPAGPPLAVDIDDLLIPVDPADSSDGPAGPAPKKSPRKARRTRRTPDPVADTAEQERPPRYETMAAWFKGWFHPLIERQVSSALIWCPQWWRHGEAITILDALWTSWEGARASDDPDAMLVWWERATGMLQHLTSPDFGPFAACSSRRHQIDDGDLALPYHPEPPGHFGWILDTGPDGYGTTPP